MSYMNSPFLTSTPMKSQIKTNGKREEDFVESDSNEYQNLKEIINQIENKYQRKFENLEKKCESLIDENHNLTEQVEQLNGIVKNQAYSLARFEMLTDDIQSLQVRLNELQRSTSNKNYSEMEHAFKSLINESINSLMSHFDLKIDLLINGINGMNIQYDISNKGSTQNISRVQEYPQVTSHEKGDVESIKNKSNVSQQSISNTNISTPNTITQSNTVSKPFNINSYQQPPMTTSLFGSNNAFGLKQPETNINQQKPSLFSTTTDKQKLTDSKLFDGASDKFLFKPPNLNDQPVFGSKFMSDKSNLGDQKTSVFAQLKFNNENENSDKKDTNFFKSLSENSADFGFGSSNEVTWKQGGKLFENIKPKSGQNENDEHDDSANVEEECSAHFEPIVEMPPLVQLSKDEDNFNVLFKSRCKLFRHVDNEWKERGVGEIKILKPKDDKSNNPIRLLMRREQVGKICCNQAISKKVPNFTTMNEKSACWYAQDYSENEPKKEKLAIRFGKEVTMEEFRKTIENLQKEMSD